MAMTFIFLILSQLAAAQVKYPDVQTKKFKSGKLQQKTTYSAYNSVESSEVYFENGKLNLKYDRKELSKDPFKPDVYNYKEQDDSGNVLLEGLCYVSPTENFFGNSRCYTFSGTQKNFNEDGELFSEAQLTKSQLDGLMTEHAEGKIIQTHYKKGIKTKRQVIDRTTKAVLKTDEYYEDGSKK